MLSRHNIRIKVLQSLYAQQSKQPITAKSATKDFLNGVNESYNHFILNLYYLLKVADYSKKDLEIRSNKLVPTEEDKKASLQLYENKILESIRNNEPFQEKVKKLDIPSKVDSDLVRKLYKAFYKSEYYDEYLAMEDVSLKEQQYCLVNLYKTMLKEVHFLEEMVDQCPNFVEDQSLVFGAIKRSIRSLPQEENFCKKQLPNPDFVHDFGIELIRKTIKEDDLFQELIVEKLKNWNEDRVAIMDMILLKMGVCEFLYFETIPTKVTINEYVSVAKDYSTDKSKRFINGILDRIMKDLDQNNRIKKKGRGLKDN